MCGLMLRMGTVKITEFYKILDEFNIFDKIKQKDEKPKKESKQIPCRQVYSYPDETNTKSKQYYKWVTKVYHRHLYFNTYN